MTAEYREQILNNYLRVLQNVEEAAKNSGRNPEDIKLVVVTKKQPVEVVEAAYQCGMRKFGENYAEEGLIKINALNQMNDIEWHMIGHVQSRKARLVCENYQYVHSLDSKKLAEKLNIYCQQRKMKLPVLLEVNVSGEISKSGFRVAGISDKRELLNTIDKISTYEHIEIHGLMTMPPFSINPRDSIPCYDLIIELQNYLQINRPTINWKELSMGTSFDYQVAIEKGATIVRIGEAILGSRNKKLN